MGRHVLTALKIRVEIRASVQSLENAVVDPEISKMWGPLQKRGPEPEITEKNRFKNRKGRVALKH
jgi:hypothetical protein